MKPAQLGTVVDIDQPAAVDLNELIGSHLGVIANSGGGKSGLIRKLLEQTHGQVLQIVLDPEDEFYTLRQRAEYVIAGGSGGDAPATVAGAAGLARLSLEHGFSLIAQLNDLGGDAADFVTAFLGGLMAAPAELWRPTLIVLDEAQRFCSRDNGEATPAVKDLLYRGRKRGFTACLASLRMAEIDAGVRGMINNWAFGRVGQALDRRTMAGQLGFAATDPRLQGMAKRTFWLMGPALTDEPTLMRVGDVDTTIVERGAAKPPTPPAPDALRQVLADLAAAAPSPPAYPDDSVPADPAAAYAKGGEVGGMLIERDRRIAKLEQELAQRDSRIGTLELLAKRTLTIAGRITDDVAALLLLIEAPDDHANLHPADADSHPADYTIDPAADEPAPRSAADRAAGNLTRGRKALAALAAVYPAVLTETQWATLAGYARSGGTWGTYKGALRAAGHIVQDAAGRWQATRTGLAEAGTAVSPLPAPGVDRAAFWAGKIPGVRRMVDVLVKRWPHHTTRDALAADLGMSATGGTFTTYLGRLRANGLIEEQGKRLRLSGDMMRGARP